MCLGVCACVEEARGQCSGVGTRSFLWVLGIELQPSDSVGSAGQVQLPIILFVNPGTGLQTPVILFTIFPAELFLQPSSSLQKGEAGI